MEALVANTHFLKLSRMFAPVVVRCIYPFQGDFTLTILSQEPVYLGLPAPKGLPWLSISSFTPAKVTNDLLHFHSGFQDLLDWAETVPYIHNGRINHEGCLRFLLGMALGYINCNFARECKGTKYYWGESELDKKSEDSLHQLCEEAMARFSEAKENLGAR